MNLVRAELLKIRTTSTWWIFGIVMLPLWVLSLLINWASSSQSGEVGGDTERVRVAAEAVNVAANFALIPVWGMTGAAAASLLAYAVMALTLFLLGRKLYPVPYEWDRLARLACVFAACSGLLWSAWAGTGGSGALWLIARVAGLAAYPALLWAGGFLTDDERSALRLRWSEGSWGPRQ